MTDLTIANGNGPTIIGPSAFNDCHKLRSLIIPDSVVTIGDLAFQTCADLTNLTLGNGVTNIGKLGFAGCTSLRSVTIPDSVTTLSDSAFGGCTNLTNVVIGNGLNSINRATFSGCTKLRSVIIPNTVTNVGALSFYRSGLTNVTLGNGVTTIGSQAFQYCPLTSITIPLSVTNIGDGAFNTCTNLTSIYFQGSAPALGGTAVFSFDPAIVYYLPGTTGWSSPFGGLPAVLWNPSLQGCGVQNDQFSFTITGTTDIPIVLEASTDLTNPSWTPLQSSTLTNGSINFADPDWTDFPSRYYRIRSP